MTLLLVACPRCGGAMADEADHFGAYWQCLSCGYLRDVDGRGRRVTPLPLPSEVALRRAKDQVL